LERCGDEHVGSCEINEYARKIYCKNFGSEPTEKDIRMVNPSDLPDFDILTAGFPCQAFSIAGKRLGFDDDRGNLFFEIARIVKQKRPKTLLLENVKGLLNHDRGRTFGTILNTLYELGYDVEWQVINGKYFVPQNRERVFIIGHLREKPFRKVFPLEFGNRFNNKTQITTQGEGQRLRSKYSGTIDSNYWKGGRTIIAMLTERRTEEAKKIRQDIRKQTGKDYSPRRGKVLEPREDDIGNCLTANQTIEHILLYKDNYKLRQLTPLECERLMGFPDGWTEGLSDTQRYKCLGNAVIPAVVEEIIFNIHL
jgi:DNA (cytosine-5)-methyltransferase 1